MALGCPPHFSANFSGFNSGFNSGNTIHNATYSSFNSGHRSGVGSFFGSFRSSFGTCFSNFVAYFNPQGPAASANPYIISKVKYNNIDVILDTQDNNQKIEFNNNYINVYPINTAISPSQYPDIPLSSFLYNAPYFIDFSANLYQKQSSATKIVDDIYYCVFFSFGRSASGNDTYGYDYPAQFSSFSVYSPDLQLSNFFDQYAQFYYTNDSNGRTYFDNLTINEINSFQFYDIEENQTFFYKNDQFAYIQENITTTPVGIFVLKAKDETSLTSFLNSSPSSLVHILFKEANSLTNQGSDPITTLTNGYNYMVQQVYIPEYIRNNFSFISLTDSTTKYLVKNAFYISHNNSYKQYYNTNNIIQYNSENDTLTVLQRSPTLSTASSIIIQNEINGLYT